MLTRRVLASAGLSVGLYLIDKALTFADYHNARVAKIAGIAAGVCLVLAALLWVLDGFHSAPNLTSVL